MRRVFICSPLKADTKEGILKNIKRAQDLCHLAMTRGGGPIAPFASHAFYTLFLDDSNPIERAIGMDAGNAWLRASHEVWAWTKLGVTPGMEREIILARQCGINVLRDPSCWASVIE
jgi:hypothetical protein